MLASLRRQQPRDPAVTGHQGGCGPRLRGASPEPPKGAEPSHKVTENPWDNGAEMMQGAYRALVHKGL